MAKRYYQNMSDRARERRGMMKKMRMHEEYAGAEMAKKQAAEDSMMIRDDYSQPCLLPSGAVDRDWPNDGRFYLGREQDLFNGVQKQLSEDGSDMRKVYKPGKY